MSAVAGPPPTFRSRAGALSPSRVWAASVAAGFMFTAAIALTLALLLDKF